MITASGDNCFTFGGLAVSRQDSLNVAGVLRRPPGTEDLGIKVPDRALVADFVKTN